MKLCIFPQNARDFILDSSNITYNLEKRAQARLGRSAPCLRLPYISIQQTVQSKYNATQQGDLKKHIGIHKGVSYGYN